MGLSRGAVSAYISAFNRGYEGVNRSRYQRERIELGREKVKSDFDKFMSKQAAERERWVEKLGIDRGKAKKKAAVQEKDRGFIREFFESGATPEERILSTQGLSKEGLARLSSSQTLLGKITPKPQKIRTLGTEEVISEDGYVDKITRYSDGTQRIDKTLKLAPTKKGQEPLLDADRDLKDEWNKYAKYAFELDQLLAGAQNLERGITALPRSKSPYYREGGIWGLDVARENLPKRLKGGEEEDFESRFIPEMPPKLRGAIDLYKDKKLFYQQTIERNLFTNDLKEITKKLDNKQVAKVRIEAVLNEVDAGTKDLTDNEVVALRYWYKFKFGEYFNWQGMTNNQN